MLIAIEGVDGSGKSSVLWELNKRFPRLPVGYGGFSASAEQPKQLGHLVSELKLGKLVVDNPIARALPFSLLRAANVANLRAARSSQSTHLVLDRYVMTNVAQAYYLACKSKTTPVVAATASEIAAELAAIEFDFLALPVPDATFVLRTPPVVAQNRIAGDSSRQYHSSPESRQEWDLTRLTVLDYAFCNVLWPLFSARGALYGIDTMVEGNPLSVRQVVDQIVEVLEREALL